jgi:hypothetical protein
MDRICEALGKEKKNKKKLEKHKSLPVSKRDEMIDLYYKRAKLKFRMKVFKDILIRGGTQAVEKDQGLKAMKEDLKSLEKKLGFKKDQEKAKDPIQKPAV